MENLFLARYASSGSKLNYIQMAGAKLDVMKFFIQITWEIKILDHKQFAAISVPLDEIGKMIGGWQKQIKT